MEYREIIGILNIRAGVNNNFIKSGVRNKSNESGSDCTNEIK